MNILSGKNRRLSSILDSYWRNLLGEIAKVMPFCEHYGPDVDIYTRNSSDNSGSNETMQKVLASIVFSKKFGGQKFQKLELLCFLSNLDEI